MSNSNTNSNDETNQRQRRDDGLWCLCSCCCHLSTPAVRFSSSSCDVTVPADGRSRPVRVDGQTRGHFRKFFGTQNDQRGSSSSNEVLDRKGFMERDHEPTSVRSLEAAAAAAFLFFRRGSRGSGSTGGDDDGGKMEQDSDNDNDNGDRSLSLYSTCLYLYKPLCVCFFFRFLILLCLTSSSLMFLLRFIQLGSFFWFLFFLSFFGLHLTFTLSSLFLVSRKVASNSVQYSETGPHAVEEFNAPSNGRHSLCVCVCEIKLNKRTSNLHRVVSFHHLRSVLVRGKIIFLCSVLCCVGFVLCFGVYPLVGCMCLCFVVEDDALVHRHLLRRPPCRARSSSEGSCRSAVSTR